MTHRKARRDARTRRSSPSNCCTRKSSRKHSPFVMQPTRDCVQPPLQLPGSNRPGGGDMIPDNTLASARPLLCLCVLLTGCAGHEAMTWKQPEPRHERTATYCVVKPGDTVCKTVSQSAMHRILRDMERQQQGLM